MATKKKEAAKPEVIQEDSEAASTLQPNSKPTVDGASRTEMLSKVIGALHQIDTESLAGYMDQVLAQVAPGVTQGGPADADKNAASLTTHPSAAQGSGPLVVKDEVKHDVETLLGSTEGLTEEFKTKASTLFEAAVEARIILEKEEIKAEIEKEYEVEYENTVKELCEHLDNYLDYVAGEWFKENEVAIVHSLRNEIVEEFMAGLKNLFVENYITIPEDEEDVVETLTDKISELEEHLNTLIGDNSKLLGEIETLQRKEVIEETLKTVPLIQQKKFQELCENIEFDNLDNFKKKLDIIKETHFTKQPVVKKDDIETLNEDASLTQVETTKKSNDDPLTNDPLVARIAAAISKNVKK